MCIRVCVLVCVSVRAHVCVCVCERKKERAHTYICRYSPFPFLQFKVLHGNQTIVVATTTKTGPPLSLSRLPLSLYCLVPNPVWCYRLLTHMT